MHIRSSAATHAQAGSERGLTPLSAGLSELDDPRADLDGCLGPLPGRDDRLGVALAKGTQDEEAGNARLARALCHDLEPLSVALQGKTLEVLFVERYPPPPQNYFAGDDTPVGKPHSLKVLFTEKLFRPPLDPADPLLIEQCSVLRRQGEALSEKGHVFGEHLLHADAHARTVDGAVYDEQFLAGGAVAVADHAGEVGDAEEAREVLEGRDGLPGSRCSDDEAGAIGLARSQHREVPLAYLDALYFDTLDSNAEALGLGEARLQEVRARDSAKTEIVLDMLCVVGPSPGTVEKKDAKVIAAEVDAGLQAARAGSNDNAVEEFSGL